MNRDVCPIEDNRVPLDKEEGLFQGISQTLSNRYLLCLEEPLGERLNLSRWYKWLTRERKRVKRLWK